jgi:hypothetical protein
MRERLRVNLCLVVNSECVLVVGLCRLSLQARTNKWENKQCVAIFRQLSLDCSTPASPVTPIVLLRSNHRRPV